MRRPLSLTSRLVLTAVALVAVVTLLVSTATVLAMRSYLTSQLDDRVDAVARSFERPDSGPGGPGPGAFGNQAEGTLISGLSTRDGERVGVVLGAGFESDIRLDDEQVDALEPAGARPGTVEVPGLGGYRVRTVGEGDSQVVVGLPTDDLDESVARLATLAGLLTLAGIAAAGAAGLLVVRRQLAPLREVAETAHRVSELPLATGEIDLGDRVPARLTDERTEVGQVGSALNSLLDHVEASLEARHRSEQQVRQFVADASHELRSPLATIQGYSELARRQPDEAPLALAKVEQESVRMSALVEDLLLLARLDSGRPLSGEPVDVTRLLIESVSDARVLAPGHHWRLDLPDAPLELVGDEQRLHQVVSNLLTNARKHTPEGTTVTVSARAGEIRIHDDGPGFSPEVARAAFDRFVRGDAARTRTAESGAGLGLAIVSAIAAAHGGTVALASVPGDTTVSIRLPGLVSRAEVSGD